MSRAKTSGLTLTKQDAALIKGMLHRGDRQHDIASWFGVNSGRIAEISTRSRFSEVLMQRDRLPPVGPYLTGQQSHDTKTALIGVHTELKKMVSTTKNSETMLNELEKIIKTIDEMRL